MAAYRCSACGEICKGWAGFRVHRGKSPFCEDEDATAEVYDEAAEATAELNRRVGEASYAADMQAHMVNSYADLYYEKMVGRTCIQGTIKEGLVEPMVKKIKDEIYLRLAKTPADSKTLEGTIGTVFDVHRGIETAAKEEGVLRRTVKPVTPVKRALVDRPGADGAPTGPRTGDYVYDVPIASELEAMLGTNPELLAQLKAASDSWACEQPAPGSSRTVYADISDGATMRQHPHLGTGADRSDGSVRLAFILYYDDLEVVNPLGAFHGTHKLGMFYWALVNVEQSTRMAFHNLHLMTVALVSDIDYYGIEQVVSGLEGDTSFGSAMTALDSGVTLRLSGGATSFVRGWCVCLSADFPAAALCCGFKKSVSAACFCRECYVDKTEEDYPAPNSFIDENLHLKCSVCLRDRAQMEEDLMHFQSLTTQTARDEFLASIGMNTFNSHAFTRVPHFDICRDAPYDFMHVELEGSLKNELAAMLFYFLRKRPGWNFSLEGLNAAIRAYPWPSGFSPPTFTSGYLEKGTKGGLAKKGAHVHMTSGDMMIFARHSIDLMLPLIGDVSDPLWRCWVAHVRYVRLLLQHSLTRDEVVLLDELIYEHHKLFLACKEYGERMFKPKNHFACHFPTDILNHGPVRTYWCMRFEALNQLFKTFAKTGAFRDTCGRCADMWTMKTAIERASGSKASTWGAPTAVHMSQRRTYRRQEKPVGVHPIAAEVIAGLFERRPKASQLKVSWISTLCLAGSEYHAGTSWLQATIDGETVLAFIPPNGIFEYNDRTWFIISIYPQPTHDADYGLPVCTVPSGYQPPTRIVRVDSAKLASLVPLWPAYRVERGGTVVYRFAPLL